MKKFKALWEIQQNWQLLFPVLGLIGLIYSALKLSRLLVNTENIFLLGSVTIVITYALLRFTLFLFKKLENKWIVDYKWEMIRIFIVFAITGTSSVFVGRPIVKLIGITKENLNPVLYWILYIIIGLIFYQILLVCIGWLFGQFNFFWNFEKKMLRRFGLGRFLNE
ncbi:DUF6787 family protein [Pontimicrobium sp. IMCC45349]|uniref:DUF6787 family protein n=1 Tax=Pontimicrobium sp. IMCC45349 TaxID=3391574 RepID=UPI00399F71DF